MHAFNGVDENVTSESVLTIVDIWYGIYCVITSLYACLCVICGFRGGLWCVVVCVNVVAAERGEVRALKKVRRVLWQKTIIGLCNRI